MQSKCFTTELHLWPQIKELNWKVEKLDHTLWHTEVIPGSAWVTICTARPPACKCMSSTHCNFLP